jgi:predicted DNA-binding transcriptional regulator AlpA
MEFLTVADLAALLKVSRRTICDLITPRMRNGHVREHPLPAIRIGRSVRFKKSDVEAWLEKLARK